MAPSVNDVRVRLASDGFYPETFRWAGRDVRVLSVEGLRTYGHERRFRVRTIDGVYELVCDTLGNVWRMRRSPTWFGRAVAHLAREPRYTLPAASRRSRRPSRSRDLRRGSVERLEARGT